jgi:serine/threonine-protein kinase RsbW
VGGIEAERLLEVSLSAVPASCRRARYEIGAALEGLAVDRDAVALAVSEAVTNAVVHAYRHRVTAHPDDRVDVSVTADADGVWITVSDDGVGMSPRDDSPGLGLGLHVIAKLTDQLLIAQGATGTRVHMRFSFRPRRRGPPMKTRRRRDRPATTEQTHQTALMYRAGE